MSPLAVTDPKIRRALQIAGVRFARERARWLAGELTIIGNDLLSGKLSADEVDAKLDAMGILDLVYPELMVLQ